MENNKKKAKKPLKYSVIVGTYPFLSFIVMLILYLIPGMILGTVGLTLTPPGPRHWLVYKDHMVQRSDGYAAAIDQIDSHSKNKKVAVRSKMDIRWTMQFMYIHKSRNGNLLTPKILNKIKKLEDDFYKDGFKNWCLSDGSVEGTCDKQSMLSSLSRYKMNDTQAKIDSIMLEHSKTDQRMFLGKEFSSTNMKSSALRSFVQLGGPLPGFLSPGDRYQEQLLKVHDYVKDKVFPVQDKDYEDFDFLPWSNTVWDIRLTEVVGGDTMFAVGSIFFVIFYMCIHTRSFFVTSLGVLGILLALPLTIVVYIHIYGISFFEQLHMMTIFVILGIGADDIFVFSDAWNQAAIEMHNVADSSDLVARLDWTYRRASKAMFVTSFTTAVAFAATTVSDLMPLCSFGIFTSTLIAMNYLIVITYFPPILVLWEKYFRFMCSKSKVKKEVELDKIETPNNVVPSTTVEDTDVQWNRTERFFYNVWANLTNRFKFVFIFFFVVWIVIASYFTSELGPHRGQVVVLGPKVPIQMAWEMSDTRFQTGSHGNTVRVNIMWGINKDNPVNRDGVDFFNSDELGKPNYVPNFSISSAETQIYLNQTCEELRPLALAQKVTCFIDSYRQWREANNKTFPAVLATDAKTQDSRFVQDIIKFLQTPDGFSLAKDRMLGIDADGKIKFARLSFLIDLVAYSPKTITLPHYEKWEDWMNKKNSKPIPSNLGKGYQYTHGSWSWMATEDNFFTSAISGMFLSFAVAFIVLVLSTTNIYVAMYAAITIAGVVLSVTATMTFRGWNLGVSESICIIIVVGFSVDYVVHLGNSYVEALALHGKREDAMRHALREMGISILGGGVTTFGSSLFLWGGVSLFFQKFAYLMEMTVFFSLVWSLAFFSSMCNICGPEGNQGSILKCCPKKD